MWCFIPTTNVIYNDVIDNLIYKTFLSEFQSSTCIKLKLYPLLQIYILSVEKSEYLLVFRKTVPKMKPKKLIYLLFEMHLVIEWGSGLTRHKPLIQLKIGETLITHTHNTK